MMDKEQHIEALEAIREVLEISREAALIHFKYPEIDDDLLMNFDGQLHSLQMKAQFLLDEYKGAIIENRDIIYKEVQELREMTDGMQLIRDQVKAKYKP